MGELPSDHKAIYLMVLHFYRLFSSVKKYARYCDSADERFKAADIVIVGGVIYRNRIKKISYASKN